MGPGLQLASYSLDRRGGTRHHDGLWHDPYAYYHLVVKTGEPNLSAAMHWLQASYTVWHNSGHQRSGHLFQGLFKAFLVQEQSYLQRLLLYVHRNPLRADLVKRLRDYPWSSYRALAYNRRTPDWFDPGLVYRELETDAVTLRRAIANYDEQEAVSSSPTQGKAPAGRLDLPVVDRRTASAERDRHSIPCRLPGRFPGQSQRGELSES